ncbi:MAG TPA: phosphopantetheine-binding protein [Streptosporangiaceae bacterium]|nr:phosphopantetheine-binding protein [Streptosporangiaceae bacterium]
MLGIDHAVAADDDFFALGGHSLLAVELTFAIFDTFGVEVSLHELLEEPTMGSMARLLDERVPASGVTAFVEDAGAFAELSAEQARWLFDDA